jgi:hypothetical protein
MSHLYRGPSIDALYQVLVHLAKRFQRRIIYKNQLIRNIWPSDFREDFLKSTNQKQELAVVAMFVNG